MTKPPRKKRGKRKETYKPAVQGPPSPPPVDPCGKIASATPDEARRLQNVDGGDERLSPRATRQLGGARLHLVGASSPTHAELEHDELREIERAARDEILFPARGFVLGEPVDVVAVHFTGHPRAGLRATCNRAGGVYDVALADVAFPPASAGARFVARYRAWLGLRVQVAIEVAIPPARRELASDEIAFGQPLELIVLAVEPNALHCRPPGSSHERSLQTRLRNVVPGELITLLPTKVWLQDGHTWLAGKVQARRGDATALLLTPLALYPLGEWNPETQHWLEDDAREGWAAPIVARGPRPLFEMEQVLPRVGPEEYELDPIDEAMSYLALDAEVEARELLRNTLALDLRCLDAHALLGSLESLARPELALRHYKLGMDIGALSLGEHFGGVLAWRLRDNRPFLRCMLGVAVCWWRIGKTQEAAELFGKMLWLNPGDDQGARFYLAAIEAGHTWAECVVEP
jgi:hypothetical protein